jgi:protein O-GlcNAc transferase
LSIAIDSHRQGRLADAAASYQSILAQEADQFDALHLLGLLRLQQGQVSEAHDLVARAVAARPSSVDALSSLVGILIALDRNADALLACDRVLAIDARHWETLYNRGVLLAQNGRREDAVASYRQALAIKHDDLDTLFNCADALAHLGQDDEALRHLDCVLAIVPGHIGALLNRGNVLLKLGRPGDAIACYDAILAEHPGHVDALNNRGTALKQIGDLDAALTCFDRALLENPDHGDSLINRGGILLSLHRHEEALDSYQSVLKIKPDEIDAWIGCGNALLMLDRAGPANAAFDRALTVDADSIAALNGCGAALHRLGHLDSAMVSYDRSLTLAPAQADVLSTLATLAMKRGRYQQAIERLEQLRKLQPDNPLLASNLARCHLYACDWTGTEQIAGVLVDAVRDGNSAVDPFCFLSFGTAAQQLDCARLWLKWRNFPREAPSFGQAKIRVAYISGDFRLHPTASLITELLALHDRSRFEIIGLSTGPDDDSEARRRIAQSVDRFFDVRDSTDREIVELARAHNIDVLVDLSGHTEYGRPGVLALRAAPVQVNYLGFPGPIGDFIDYILADPIVLPFDQQPYYRSKIVHLPDCYQANDTKRPVASRLWTRSECGLPSEGFVFCSFNNSFKITAPIFAIWMRLLHSVPSSVLWLLRSNDDAVANLQREAGAAGVDPRRLIFAPKLPNAEHLARYRLVDLVLDTLPYNSHTTGSDALLVGTPMVTCLGDTFPGRVGASLLHATGLPELVASDLKHYATIALRLARDPDELQAIRDKLTAHRPTCALFDTDRLRRHIEQAYATMVENWRSGRPPTSFSVEPAVLLAS